MQEDQLKLLEKRINSAVAFIENLKAREKKLLQEREHLQKRLAGLEMELGEKEKRNEELVNTQKYLKEKIEIILNNLEGLAELYEEEHPGQKEQNRRRSPDSREGEKALNRDNREIIVEEKVVDLRQETMKDRSVIENQEKDENPLFRDNSKKESGHLTREAGKKSGKDQLSDAPPIKWINNNPFIET